MWRAATREWEGVPFSRDMPAQHHRCLPADVTVTSLIILLVLVFLLPRDAPSGTDHSDLGLTLLHALPPQTWPRQGPPVLGGQAALVPLPVPSVSFRHTRG
ncbi:hypothetical protein FA13DRAFT_648982 [Coprinellus micaceus]|uniref:Uncharacterized protein n=1 Tax=Coprinellus micaceus TaxID=71717 RepID=A0A4Y7T5S6_COPMI|nr:hypothetical protein FA13DRAFT_648982 [Coprinellus micaceus]